MNTTPIEAGSRFSHGPWSLMVLEVRGAVALVEGRVFPTSPASWLVGRVVEEPMRWDRRRWPWRVEPGGERFKVTGLHPTEAEGRQAFEKLAGGPGR